MDKIRVGINAKYKEIAERDNYVTAEKVKNAFLGLEMRHETLLTVYAQHNEDFAKQVDAGLRSQSTYNKYCTVYQHLEEFIKTRYRLSDIALRELTPAFITDFEIFLRTEKQCCNNTVWIYMMPLRRMITIAQNHGWIVRDPFVDYSICAESTERDYLTKDEIRQMMDLKFRCKSMELVRDLYVFCCFTGLSFTDMKNLTKDNVQTSFDGKLWIMTKRQKTGEESQDNHRALRHREEHNMAYQPPYHGDGNLPDQRSPHRNTLQDARAYEYPHDTNLRQNHPRKGKPGYEYPFRQVE